MPDHTSGRESHQPACLTLDEHGASRALGVSVHFLRKDRRTKREVPFFRIGDRVLYSYERLQAMVRARVEGGVPRKRKSRPDTIAS
jgi:hypothetical protein